MAAATRRADRFPTNLAAVARTEHREGRAVAARGSRYQGCRREVRPGQSLAADRQSLAEAVAPATARERGSWVAASSHREALAGGGTAA